MCLNMKMDLQKSIPYESDGLAFTKVYLKNVLVYCFFFVALFLIRLPDLLFSSSRFTKALLVWWDITCTDEELILQNRWLGSGQRWQAHAEEGTCSLKFSSTRLRLCWHFDLLTANNVWYRLRLYIIHVARSNWIIAAVVQLAHSWSLSHLCSVKKRPQGLCCYYEAISLDRIW